MKKDDRARVRVFFGEIEGDNESIRDGLRSIAQAVNRTFQAETRVVKVITAGNGVDEKVLAELSSEIEEIDLVDSDESDTTHDSVSERSNRTVRPRKPRSYSLVKELNLRPQGKRSLREFYERKQPADLQQVLTLVVYYLQHELELEGISANHVYTGLKELSDFGVRVPNIPSMLSNISSRKGWLDTSDLSNLRSTVAGDNFIEHDLSTKSGD